MVRILFPVNKLPFSFKRYTSWYREALWVYIMVVDLAASKGAMSGPNLSLKFNILTCDM
jgi:hypothetical protein